MVDGVGIDVVNIERMEKLADGVIKRLFHPKEAEHALTLAPRQRSEYLGGRFAAKEAFGKALGTGLAGIRPSDILTDTSETGKPFLVLYGKAKRELGDRSALISIAHDPPIATAIVIVQGGLDA